MFSEKHLIHSHEAKNNVYIMSMNSEHPSSSSRCSQSRYFYSKRNCFSFSL